MTPWPESGKLLLSELAKSSGRLALTVDDPEGQVTAAFASELGVDVWHAGTRLLDTRPPETDSEAIDRLAAAGPVVDDLDLLFWQPWLRLDPLGVLRSVVRRRPGVLFAWPGELVDGVISYSRPGRRDWFEARLSDTVVLRPVPTVFPDERPYETERFA